MKLKQIKLTLLPLLCLPFLSSCSHHLVGKGTQDDPILITKSYDFKLLNDFLEDNKEYIYVKLTEDLILNATSIISNPFYGSFDGDGHELTIDVLRKYDEYGYGATSGGEIKYGLFRNVINSKFSKTEFVLTDKSKSIECSHEADSMYVAGVIGYALNTDFEDISVQGSLSYKDYDVSLGYMGGLVGEYHASESSTHSFTRCQNGASIEVKTVLKCAAGGLVGRMFSENACVNFNQCSNIGTISTSGGMLHDDVESYAGGFVGFVESTYDDADLLFSECESTGELNAKFTDAYIGGYIENL